MNLTYAGLNLFALLITSQFLTYFSPTRLHLLLFLLVFVVVGVVVGVYLAFKRHWVAEQEFDVDKNETHITELLLNYKVRSSASFSAHSITTASSRSNTILDDYNHAASSTPRFSIFTGDLIDFHHDLDGAQEVNEDLEQGNTEYDEDDDQNSTSVSNSKLDSELIEIIELVVRDFVLSSVKKLVWDPDKLSNLLKSECKQLIELVKIKLKNLDFVKFISRDLIIKLNEHYSNVKKFRNSQETFKLYTFEASEEKEKEYLSKLVELALLVSFKERNYFEITAVRCLLREIIVNKVLYPTIEMLSDPDYLNRKLIAQLETKEKPKISVSSVSSYEDLIKTIKSSKSVPELKQIYSNIMNELLQATISSNLRFNASSAELMDSQMGLPSPSLASSTLISGGPASFYAFFSEMKTIDPQHHSSNKHSDPKQHAVNDLKIHIKRMRKAQQLCERRLKNQNLGDEESIDSRLKNIRVLPFESIINLSRVQANLIKFLENDGSDALIRFWIDVDKLKRMTNTKRKYELANRIYDNYLKPYDSPVRDEIGKELNRSMQQFIIGNNTEECFYVAQDKIKSVIESDHWSSFLSSDLYQKLDLNKEYENYIKNWSTSSMMPTSPKQGGRSRSNTQRLDQTKKHISSLKEKLQMKLVALETVKSDGKLVEKLEADIKMLKHTLSVYQSHVQKTDLWCDNIGKFTTSLKPTRLPTDSHSDNSPLLFEILVQLHEKFEVIDASGNSSEAVPSSTIKEGWIIYRSLKEFESLNDSLSELLSPDMKSNFKKGVKLIKQRSFASSSSKALAGDVKLQKSCQILDSYLRAISEDEYLAQSQALYSFLCPSPDLLKHNLSQSDSVSNDDKFPLSFLFRGGSQSSASTIKTKETNEDEYLDELFSDSNLKSLEGNDQDSIAEPFYQLIEQAFGLKSMRRWFRKSLMVFVQLTFGANINRKIREYIYWTFSNDMLAHYLKQVKLSFWKASESDETLLELINITSETRTEQEKAQTKREAKERLISSVPDTIYRLLGEKNAQNGLAKLYDTFQDKRLNKHLIYSIIDVLVNELWENSKHR